MSVISVPDKDIDRLVTAALAFGIVSNGSSADQLGRILLAQNARAFADRYSANDGEDLVSINRISRYHFRPEAVPSFAELKELLDHYVYNAEDSPDWLGSEACLAIQRLQVALWSRPSPKT